MELAAVYCGPPQWTLGRAFTLWQADPVVLTIVVAGTLGYLFGLLRLRRRDERWPIGRTAAFLLGMALWVFTVCSGLGVYERVLFTDRAVQAVLLLMVVPLLLAMGAPVTVLVEAAPQRSRERLSALLRGRVSQVLMFPLVSTVLLIVPPWLLYFTRWYQLSLASEHYDILFHVSFVLFGLAYFWPRLQIDPVGRHYHPMIGVVITVTEVMCDAGLGAILVFGGHLLIPHYWAALDRPWGMSPLADQKWGGAVLWGLGDIAGVPFMVALVARVVKEERARTVKVDQELDEQQAARELARLGTAHQHLAGTGETAAASARPTPSAAALQEAQELSAPWWETDPRFAHLHPRSRTPD
ncbi:cytochrome c oxidase assembly protein [Streptacidiphilus sp. PB12-B1b]|uniref:cytochrome c oxidase assembly protein n=1 Tax=Streptacidiphilus sp. PB12-B1b TaxID=2705012 RepID=UPI0015FC8B90|nr:cytochrome c oxidase assembly protein [Streptacidiphilus sp. PB12-B1b]QMU74700.1 cytochrome c oxidase assembly protein [Streptacidiphilus sp. PB12-B1b]